MPDLSDFEIFDLTGMDIDSVSGRGEFLRASFGGGYGVKVSTGASHLLMNWTLSSGALPDSESYGNLIDSQPRFAYYWDFYTRHTAGTKDVFQIEFRGKNYHACFASDEMTAEMFSIDLFAGGVEIRQRKVRGITYDTDGSILEIQNLPGLFSWHVANNGWVAVDKTWASKVDSDLALIAEGGTNVIQVNDVQNGLPVIRLNASGNDSFLVPFADPTTPTVFDLFMVMKMREATFSNDCGLVTADTAVALLLGDSGETEFTNIGISDFEYRLNGVTHTQAAQTAPMNTFGVVHLRFTGVGFSIQNIQFGKDRGNSGTFAEVDIGEIIIIGDALLSDGLRERVTRYLMTYWAIT